MLGVSAGAAAAWLQEQQPALGDGQEEDTGPLLVWPENRQVLGLFMRLQTQWRHSPRGRPEGLDYTAVQARMTGMGIADADRARLWDELEDMEHAVLEAWDEL